MHWESFELQVVNCCVPLGVVEGHQPCLGVGGKGGAPYEILDLRILAYAPPFLFLSHW